MKILTGYKILAYDYAVNKTYYIKETEITNGIHIDKTLMFENKDDAIQWIEKKLPNNTEYKIEEWIIKGKINE